MKDQIDIFEKESECDYKGEHYSVRDNGAVMRHPKNNHHPRRLDCFWTFGKKDDKTGYMFLGPARVHQIVATAFYGPPESSTMIVDHKDTNRCNNRAENLRWLTRLENALNNPITRKRIILCCGSISAGKTDLNNLETSAWLSRCGAVMQSGYIFSGSVMENIALADHEPDMERVVKAARIACIDDFIATLPMSYNTRIGATGIELSGGQKQRLFIARAVYKDPQYVFLDEATSSLDANNEKMVISNLMEFYKGRTVVIAAHRLSTIKNSDKIIYIERGVIQEEGDHNELVARQGKYFQLMQNQLS